MNYQEKLKHAEEFLNHMNNGKTNEEINQIMISNGISKFDLKKVERSAKNMLSEKYGDKIKTYLLQENLEEHLDEFEELDEATFNEIQLEQHQKIITNSNSLVSRLLKEGKSRDEIIEQTSNPYYNALHVDKQIEKYNYYNTPIEGGAKTTQLLLGGGAILLGIILTASSSGSGGTTFYYGLIIFGVISLFRSFQTQSDIDNRD